MNFIGPRSIFPPLFTPSVYFLLLLSVAVTIIIISCVWSFVNSKAGGIDNPSVLVGSKVTCCVCRSTSTSYQPATISGAVDIYLYFLWVLRRQTLVSSPREIATTLHLKPSTWGNQRGARSHQSLIYGGFVIYRVPPPTMRRGYARITKPPYTPPRGTCLFVNLLIRLRVTDNKCVSSSD